MSDIPFMPSLAPTVASKADAEEMQFALEFVWMTAERYAAMGLPLSALAFASNTLAMTILETDLGRAAAVEWLRRTADELEAAPIVADAPLTKQ